MRRQNEIWKLVYGTEWGEVREFALATLVQWHHGSPHQWPLNVVMDVWEELHWRFFEELKDVLRALKREAKRETLSLQEIRFYALLPGPDGQAWLNLPSTFDLMVGLRRSSNLESPGSKTVPYGGSLGKEVDPEDRARVREQLEELLRVTRNSSRSC